MFKRKRISIAVGVVGALAAVGGISVATGAIPSSSDGVIHACYGSNGEVRLLDKEAGKTCSKGWTPLSWNQRGVQGQMGPQGEQGPRGPSRVIASFTDATGNLPDATEGGVFNFPTEPVLVLPLPAGNWHIQAKAFVNGDAGNAACLLTTKAGPESDHSLVTLPSNRAVETLSVQMLQRFDAPNRAELRCTDYGAIDGTVRGLFQVKLHATQIESFEVVNGDPNQPGGGS